MGEITASIAKALKKDDLQLIQTHTYMYELALSSEVLVPEIEAAMAESIRISCRIGIGCCAFQSGSSVTSEFKPEVPTEENKRAFSTCLELANRCGTGIGVKNLPIFNHSFHIMPYFGYNCGDLCRWVDYFVDSNIRNCWDTGYANMVSFARHNLACLDYLEKTANME